MAKGRLEDFDMDDMHRWTSMVREEFKRNRPQSHQLLNFDEIALWCDRSSEKRVFMTSNRQPNIRATHHLLSVKVLAFVVANGTRFLTVVIVKGKGSEKDGFIEPEQATPRLPATPRTATDMCYFRCRSGNLTQHSFGLIMDRFIEEWRAQNPGLHAWIFGDQFSPHLNLFTMRKMLENNLHMWFFPANTSHFLQPLDDVPFARIKGVVKKESDFLPAGASIANRDVTPEFHEVLHHAITRGLRSKEILAGFRNTGVWPFRTDVICKRAAESLGKEISSPDGFASVVNGAISTLSGLFSLAATGSKAKKRRFEDMAKCDGSHQVQQAISSGQLLVPPAKRKKTKEQQAVDRAMDVSARKCIINGCERKFCGGLGWTRCLTCQGRICPQHPKPIWEVHLKDCAEDGEVDIVGVDDE
jgi:hypothetical protein